MDGGLGHGMSCGPGFETALVVEEGGCREDFVREEEGVAAYG
jgi:hypothetical protein